MKKVPLPYRGLILVSAVLGLFFTGCDFGGPTWEKKSPARGDGPGETIIPKTTNVLGDEAVESMQTTADRSTKVPRLPKTLVFSSTTALDSVEVGDVIASGPSKKAPLGFLRKVTARKDQGGKVTLETRDASLNEAIAKGTVDTTITITERNVSKNFYDGLRGRGENVSPKAIAGFCNKTQDSICISESLGLEGPIDLETGLSFKPEINLKIDIGLSGTNIKFTVENGYRAEFGLLGGIDDGGGIQREIFEKRLSTFVVAVGPLPVTISPYAGLEAGIQSEAQILDSRAYWAYESSRTVGLRYDESWNTIEGGENSGLNFITKLPSLNNIRGRLDVEPFLNVNFELRVYESVGPQAIFEPFGLLRFTTGENNQILYQPFLGVGGKAGFNVEPFGLDIAQYETDRIFQIKDALNEKKPLPATAPDEEFPGTTDPPEALEASAQGGGITLRWRDPSGTGRRYHVFRSSVRGFGSGQVLGDEVQLPALGIVERGNSDPIEDTSYADEDVQLGTTYYYRVTAVDGEGNETEGSEQVQLTAQLPPPGNLKASSGDQQATLDWTAHSAESVDGYNIYRSTSPFEDVSGMSPINRESNTQDDQTVKGTNYTDTEVENGTKYYYRVTAVSNPAGDVHEGQPSDLVPVTPLPDPPDRP